MRARQCWGEKPLVFEATAKTAPEALEGMAQILKLNGIENIGGINIHFNLEENQFELVVFAE